MKILVTPTSLASGKGEKYLAPLREVASELRMNPYGRPLSEEELIEQLQGCEGYLAGLDSVTARVMGACPNLRAISRYGAGCDRVDVQAARERGILVANTPGVNAQAVGELAFGMAIALARRLVYLDKTTKAGEWVRSTGMELCGKNMGILGLGAIGKVVARCAQGFSMQVLAYDPRPQPEYCDAHNIRAVSFETLLRESDVVSLHLPLTQQTKRMISQPQLEWMKPGALLINASRGGIVDEDAAFSALQEGKLGGLGLDAFEHEPPEGNPLLQLDNVIVTPHTGAHTKEAVSAMAELAVRNLVQMLREGTCFCLVK